MGLAEIVRHEIDSDYIAGIWEDDVEQGLLWRLNQNGEEPQSYRAPSWATLQIKSSVYGIIGGRDDQNLYATVTGFQARSFTLDIEWLNFLAEKSVQKYSDFHVPPPEVSYLQLSCNISPALNSNRQWNTYTPAHSYICWIDGTYGDT